MTRAGRIGLALGCLVVAGLLVGLFFAVREPAPVTHSAPVTAVNPRSDAAPAHVHIAPVMPGPTPQAPEAPVDTPDAGPRVHDHRGDDAGAPPVVSALTNETRVELRAAVKPFVESCTSHLREANPPVHGRVMISIRLRAAGGRLTTSDITVAAEPILGAEVDGCITQALSTLDLEAPTGQADGVDTTRLLFMAP